MTPKRLFFILTSCWTITALSSAALVFAVWNTSTPGVADAVAGVSTTSLTPDPTPSLAPYPVFNAPANPDILAKEYTLYNPNSGKTLLASSTMSPVPIASTTKLMTVYLVASADTAELDTYFTITQAAVDQPTDASVMGLVIGEKITMRSLLYGTLLVSGGDAAYMLAEIRGGELLGDPNATSQQKITRFLQAMNTEAAALHMDHTHYTDPTGYDATTMSTADDLAKIMYLDSQNSTLQGIIHTSDITVTSEDGYTSHVLHNSNRLLADAAYPGMIGGKTGFTDEAGHCLTAVATRNGITLVVVILNTSYDTADASADEARKLLDIGFNNLTLE